MRPARKNLAANFAQSLLLSMARGEGPANELHNSHSSAPPAVLREITEAEWQEAIGLAEAHGLAPLLHETAQAHSSMALPEKLRKQLRSIRLAELKREEARQQVQQRALAALAPQQTGEPELPVLLLKGAASACTIYEQPELRPRSDLDLLVLPGDRERALSRLLARGYLQHEKTVGTREDEAGWHELTLTDPLDRSQQLDLHFALAQPQRHLLSAALLFSASVRKPALGAVARVLPAEEAALVCAHAIAIHELRVPLVSLCDLARLLACSDAKKLSVLARKVRLVRALHVSVELLARLGPAARSMSSIADAEPCGAFSLCGAPVEPLQLKKILAASGLSRPIAQLLKSESARYDLARAPLARSRQLWRKALFIDRPQDAARFAAAHALSALRRF